MASAETLLNYPHWKIPFTVQTDNSDKQLGAFRCQNNKSIAFLSRELIKPPHNYNMTKMEILSIAELLK